MSDQEPDKEFMRKLLFKQRILLVVFILLAAGLLAYADWHWKHNVQSSVTELKPLSDEKQK